MTAAAGAPSRVAVSGALTRVNAAEQLLRLRSELQQSAGGQGLTIDLEGLGAVDTAGLAMLLLVYREAAQRGRSVVWASAPIDLIALARLSSVESIFSPRSA